MLGLWMFGTLVERMWGPKRFLTFYLICGLVAAITQMASYAWDFRHIDSMQLSIGQINEYQTALGIIIQLGLPGPLWAYSPLMDTFSNTNCYHAYSVSYKAKWAILGIIALDVFGGISKRHQTITLPILHT